jgi:uncharacterized repeat protein (TIGR03803 family)
MVILMFATSAIVPSRAQTFTVLYTFSGSDGSGPSGSLVRDAGGNLYGTTYFGGAYTDGVAFKLDPSNNETVLFNFNPGNSRGSNPAYDSQLMRRETFTVRLTGAVPKAEACCGNSAIPGRKRCCGISGVASGVESQAILKGDC